MPRRNTPTHSRRRIAKALPPAEPEVVDSWESMANALVRRGLASKRILERSSYPLKENQP
jgi:hypothetical protein